MDWNALDSLEDWKQAVEASHTSPVVVFKHSTRCSISRMALKLTQQRWELPENTTAYLLDLLNHRDVSQAIAQDLGIQHQSPQMVLIRDGKALHAANHSNIDPVELWPYL